MAISSKNNLLRRYVTSILSEMSTRYKRETGENLPRWQERLKEYEDAGNFFVHFSFYDKLGLNPQNAYNTPTGIYAYQLRTEQMANFGTERPYVIVFKINDSSGILDLESYTDDDLFNDFDKLRNLYRGTGIVDIVDDLESKYGDGDWHAPNAGKAIWETINEIVDNSDIYRTKKIDPGSFDSSSGSRSRGKLNMRRVVIDFIEAYPSIKKAIEGAQNEDFVGGNWNEEVFCSGVLQRDRRIATPKDLIDKDLPIEQQKVLARDETDGEFYGACKKELIRLIKLIPASDMKKVQFDSSKHEYTDNMPALEKTKIFRDLGYTGVIDEGQGIIHPNEPTQAVFFETGILRHVETIKKPSDGSLEAEHLTQVPQSGRDFSGETWVDKEIKGGKYIGATLSGVEAEKSYIVASKFMRATCIRGNFVESFWSRSDLSDANFEGSLFSKCEFNSMKAVKTNLKGAVFVDTRVSSTNFFQANLESSDFLNATIRTTNFDLSSLKGAVLEKANCSGCTFKGVDFTGTDFGGASFKDCDFTSSSLDEVVGLEKATFESCKLPEGFTYDIKAGKGRIKKGEKRQFQYSHRED